MSVVRDVNGLARMAGIGRTCCQLPAWSLGDRRRGRRACRVPRPFASGEPRL